MPSQAPRSVSATELHRQLQWLPIQQQITYKIAVDRYKTRTTGTPAYRSDLCLPTRTDTIHNPLINCYWLYRGWHFHCQLQPSASVLLQSGTHCRITHKNISSTFSCKQNSTSRKPPTSYYVSLKQHTYTRRTWNTEASTDFCQITVGSVYTFWKMLKVNIKCKAKYKQVQKDIHKSTTTEV